MVISYIVVVLVAGATGLMKAVAMLEHCPHCFDSCISLLANKIVRQSM
jgi:hypothetical protein